MPEHSTCHLQLMGPRIDGWMSSHLLVPVLVVAGSTSDASITTSLRMNCAEAATPQCASDDVAANANGNNNLTRLNTN